MYFITESELRMSYRRTHFTEYEVAQKTRLTPEARQFLLDRNIRISDAQKEQLESKETEKACFKGNNISSFLKPRLEKVLASFLLIVSFLTDEDMYIAEQVMLLESYLADIEKEGSQSELPELLSDCSLSADEKHNISAFHIQLPKGRTIALLQFLIAELNLLKAELTTKNDEKETAETKQQAFAVQRIDTGCRILEGLIHKAIGGEK